MWMVAAASAAPATAPARYPIPGDYKLAGAAFYAEDAEKWVKENPDSPHTAAAMLDVMMAGTVLKDQPMIDRARLYLLLERSDSLQARYVLQSFRESKEARELLEGCFDKRADALGELEARKLLLAMVAAVETVGPDVLGTGAFPLKAAVLARDAGVRKVADQLTQYIRERCPKDSTATKAAAICFDPQIKPPEALLRIHREAHTDSLERYLYSRLTDAEKAGPAVALLRARTLLSDRKFADAATIAATIGDDRSLAGPALYLRVWCAAAQQNAKLAAELAAGASARTPDDPWVKAAAQLAQIAADAPRHVDAYVDGLLKLDAALKGADQWEMHFIETKGPGALDIYAAFGDDMMEVQVQRDKRTLLAYRTAVEGASVYFASENTVYRFKQPGMFAIPRPAMESKEGKMGITLGLNTTRDGSKVREALDQFLASPLLSTRPGARQLIEHFGVGRDFLVAPAANDQGTVYGFRFPDLEEPRITSWQIIVLADRRSLRLEGDGVTATFRFGQRSAFQFKAPAWPQAKTVTAEQIDLGMFMKLMQSAFSLFTEAFSEPQPTTQPATQGAK